jgi:putative hemolysin
MDLALLAFLIILNGAFAMSEMALTASRKARLQVLVESGQSGAQAAMDLHENPTKFLSTVQIGITSIGVLNGIVGEAAFAHPVEVWLLSFFDLEPKTADMTATALVVLIITFLTIIFGELVPKRVGQMFPETVARLAAPVMNGLSTLTRPFVLLLGASTEGVLRLLGLHGHMQRGVTEEEIAASLEEGLEHGVIEAQEHQMVRNVFRLDDRQIGSMMVPRAEIAWLDVQAPAEQTWGLMREHGHSRYPVCRGSLDEVVGVLPVHALVSAQGVMHLTAPTPAAPAPTPLAAPQPLEDTSEGPLLDLAPFLTPGVFVPETLTGMELLENLRASSTEMVFVVDEYGAVQGLITERDVLEAIAGEFTESAGEDSWAVQRDDGSWLVDGLIPVTELKDRLDLKDLPDEDRGRYNTLAGMIMLLLGRLPQTGDRVDWGLWRFEVVDLDGRRVDKVLASRLPEPGDPLDQADA